MVFQLQNNKNYLFIALLMIVSCRTTLNNILHQQLSAIQSQSLHDINLYRAKNYGTGFDEVKDKSLQNLEKVTQLILN